MNSVHPLNPYKINPFAEIAQLVEHNLAKVRVASSSLVFRSSVNIYAPKTIVLERILLNNQVFGKFN